MSHSIPHLFKSLLNDGLQRISLRLSLPVQAYVRDLLITYIPADRLFDIDVHSGKRKLMSLAEIYLKAQKASFSERMVLLRQVGDKSLYLGGFFKEALDRKLVNVNYYINIGQKAYDHLADHHPHEDIFRELSSSFLDLADVLSYIYQKHSIRTDKDLLQICRNYLKTGSRVAQCQLEDHGFSLQKDGHSH